MPTVTIRHDDGSTEQIDETVGWKYTREIGKTDRLRIHVPRDDAQAVTFEPKTDEIELAGVTTGRLTDIKTGGSAWTITAYGFDWDANKVEPLPGGTLKQGTDSELITDLVNDVPSWTVGNIATLTGPMSFVFNHAFRHEALWRIEKNVPGEIRINADKSVDYVENLGTDKTASVTLSAANGNIEDEIRITNRGRELDGTHIRVLGAHEGEAQIFANLVPETDGANYDHRVNYSTSRWSPGDPRVWDLWANKDVSDQATVEEEAAALGAELTESLVEARATAVGEDLSLGDWVHVTKPDADLDRDMRIHRITTKQEGAKQVEEVLLSTRTMVRRGATDYEADVKRYNVAFEGTGVILQGGGDRQPVTSSDNAIIPFRYPDVNFEHVAELEVRGLPYRAFSKGASGGGDHTHSVDVTHPSHSHSVDVTHPSHSHSVSVDHPSHSHSVSIPAHSHSVIVDLPHHTHAITDYTNTSTTDTTDGHDHGYNRAQETAGPTDNQTSTTTDSDGDTTETSDTALGTTTSETSSTELGTTTSETSSTELGTTTSETSGASGTHTHDPAPGIIENFPNHPQANANNKLLPSGCDVIINGTKVATDIGSGEFEVVVDITGALNKGAWNVIEVTSDNIGHILATPFISAYKQIGAN